MKPTICFFNALFLIAGGLLWGSCDGGSGTIKASINNTCSSALNFSGDHVFGNLETSGAYAGEWLIGGYSYGDEKEIGFYMPSPPTVGVYDIPSSGISLYYDPNDGNDSDDDQYAAISGEIEITSVELGSSEVINIKVKLSNVMIRDIPGSSTLCLHDGFIEIL